MQTKDPAGQPPGLLFCIAARYVPGGQACAIEFDLAAGWQAAAEKTDRGILQLCLAGKTGLVRTASGAARMNSLLGALSAG